MTKERLHTTFQDNIDQIGPVIQRALESAGLGLLTGDADFDDVFAPDPSPVIEALKSSVETSLEIGTNLLHDETIGRLLAVAQITKNPDAINDLVEAFHNLWLASSDVKATMDQLKSDNKAADVIEEAVHKETKAFANQMIKRVLSPEFNKTDFLKKSKQLFVNFSNTLHEETNFDTTKVIKPLVDELWVLTKTFAEENVRDKEIADAYRKNFGLIVAKHDEIFDAKSSSLANQLYKLVFNVLREILALVTPLLPDSVQRYVNAASTFFTPKNPNSDVLSHATEQLERDLAHQAVIEPATPAGM